MPFDPWDLGLHQIPPRPAYLISPWTHALIWIQVSREVSKWSNPICQLTKQSWIKRAFAFPREWGFLDGRLSGRQDPHLGQMRQGLCPQHNIILVKGQARWCNWQPISLTFETKEWDECSLLPPHLSFFLPPWRTKVVGWIRRTPPIRVAQNSRQDFLFWICWPTIFWLLPDLGGGLHLSLLFSGVRKLSHQRSCLKGSEFIGWKKDGQNWGKPLIWTGKIGKLRRGGEGHQA